MFADKKFYNVQELPDCNVINTGQNDIGIIVSKHRVNIATS